MSGAITGGGGRAVAVQALRNTKVIDARKSPTTGKNMSSQSLVKNGRVSNTRFYNVKGKAHFELDYLKMPQNHHSLIHGHKISHNPFYRHP